MICRHTDREKPVRVQSHARRLKLKEDSYIHDRISQLWDEKSPINVAVFVFNSFPRDLQSFPSLLKFCSFTWFLESSEFGEILFRRENSLIFYGILLPITLMVIFCNLLLKLLSCHEIQFNHFLQKHILQFDEF